MAFLSNSKNKVSSNEVTKELSVVLDNPGLPESDLTQFGYKLFTDCGLTYIVFGPSNLSSCFKTVSSLVPMFQHTQATEIGLGSIGEDKSYWLGFEGNEGSVLAYFCFPGGNDSVFMTAYTAMPLRKLPAPWQWGLGIIGAKVPETVARIFQSARAVPVWDIAGLEHTKPVETPAAPFPESLRQRLQASGAECIDVDIFKVVILTADNQPQMLFVRTWNSEFFALISPFADSIDGTVPESLRGLSFGDMLSLMQEEALKHLPESLRGRNFGNYRIEIIYNEAMFVDLLPVGPPSPTFEEIQSRSIALAIFAAQIKADILDKTPPDPMISTLIQEQSDKPMEEETTVKPRKGQKVDLTKSNPNLQEIIVGLGWVPNDQKNSTNFDIDASAFLLGSSGKVKNENDLVFYNNPSGGQGSVKHSGDNAKGSGEGDDEQIHINLSAVPSYIERIAFAITINDAQKKQQSFKDIKNSYVRILNTNTNELLLKYELGQEFSIETAIVAAELYRHSGEWKFNAIGSGFQGGLKALCHNFGIEVEDD